MGPEALAQVLRPLRDLFTKEHHPDLLVGLDGSDDAAVYRISDDCAVIQTIDFFPPIVDDPYDFGAIAAANAMSDIYAMGGEVTLALNVCCFPDDLPSTVLQEILKGGADKVAEAGAVLAGGHTVTDKELKYGLSVTGTIHPNRILRKSGARPGDALILTKQLGTGITTTALKNEMLSAEEIHASVASMKALSRYAATILTKAQVTACTDVTGFSLLGHAYEIAENSGVALHIAAEKLPFLEHAEAAAGAKCFPGGTFRNRKYYDCVVRFEPSISEQQILMMFTPETSGGLLAAVDANDLDSIKSNFERANHSCWLIGEVVEGSGIEVTS
ncbi:MAG: selenide, water dikinase SelD [Spirochaetaceae bacterium]|nr:MAG: selenide, water dikinase SelD [Spirochaetaceae bacterium]